MFPASTHQAYSSWADIGGVQSTAEQLEVSAVDGVATLEGHHICQRRQTCTHLRCCLAWKNPAKPTVSAAKVFPEGRMSNNKVCVSNVTRALLYYHLQQLALPGAVPGGLKNETFTSVGVAHKSFQGTPWFWGYFLGIPTFRDTSLMPLQRFFGSCGAPVGKTDAVEAAAQVDRPPLQSDHAGARVLQASCPVCSCCFCCLHLKRREASDVHIRISFMRCRVRMTDRSFQYISSALRGKR